MGVRSILTQSNYVDCKPLQQSVLDLFHDGFQEVSDIGTILVIPCSGGVFPKYVSLQIFNKYFPNLGSRHTSIGMPSSPGALPSS